MHLQLLRWNTWLQIYLVHRSTLQSPTWFGFVRWIIRALCILNHQSWVNEKPGGRSKLSIPFFARQIKHFSTKQGIDGLASPVTMVIESPHARRWLQLTELFPSYSVCSSEQSQWLTWRVDFFSLVEIHSKTQDWSWTHNGGVSYFKISKLFGFKISINQGLAQVHFHKKAINADRCKLIPGVTD